MYATGSMLGRYAHVFIVHGYLKMLITIVYTIDLMTFLISPLHSLTPKCGNWFIACHI